MTAEPFHWEARRQPYAEAQFRDHSHDAALFKFGEWAMFVLMWRPQDEVAGRVTRCSICYEGEGRAARAYKQGAREKCPSCFGTTFEGGYRARVIRPALFTDHVRDSSDGPRGALATDSLTVDTTSDFTFHHGDYIFRAGNGRYQAEEKGVVTIRSGFGNPDDLRSVAGTIAVSRLEDPASVVWMIPPEQTVVETILRRPISEHLPPDLHSFEVTDRGPVLL